LTPSDAVVLVHGMSRTSKSMRKLENALKEEGYTVINMDYPSTKKSIPDLAEMELGKVIRSLNYNSNATIHFITHSLGGILVRYYLSNYRVRNLGRVVMLSPPNKGSEVVDNLKGFFLFKWLTGKPGQQLGTNKDSIPNQLRSVNFDLGIITGDRTINPINSFMIPGKDDGKVSIQSAKVRGMKDFLVLHTNHAMIMKNKEAIRQAIHFLQKGKFDGE
jgi:triacylglycerol lipase